MARRILVVDDDKQIVRLIKAYLEESGYQVLVAYDGDTATHMARRENPDLLILDLMLPGSDGWEVTRTMKADATLSQLPIIMLTARIEDTDKIIGLELGADDYITKPFNPREVVARTRAVLRRVEVGGSQEIEEVGRAFNEMASTLEEAEQQRQHLMADIAHELRTPLTVLQGNLQALLDEVYPLRQEEIAHLYDETRLLSRLVDDLRELSQAEAGHLALRREGVDLAALLHTQAAHFQMAAEEKGITLTVDAAENLPAALADPDRTAQVVRNLLNNALHHTPSGGRITLCLTLEAGPPPMLRGEVVDSGSGIAPEDLPRVFDRFWRADRARSRRTGGSGLGLAIARSLVQGQGGEIGVASDQGEGARFWFTLPLWPQPDRSSGVGS